MRRSEHSARRGAVLLRLTGFPFYSGIKGPRGLSRVSPCFGLSFSSAGRTGCAAAGVGTALGRCRRRIRTQALVQHSLRSVCR